MTVPPKEDRLDYCPVAMKPSIFWTAPRAPKKPQIPTRTLNWRSLSWIDIFNIPNPKAHSIAETEEAVHPKQTQRGQGWDSLQYTTLFCITLGLPPCWADGSEVHLFYSPSILRMAPVLENSSSEPYFFLTSKIPQPLAIGTACLPNFLPMLLNPALCFLVNGVAPCQKAALQMI